MGVLHPLIAWAGLGLAALPIVLHLTMRQKPRHLEFPALRFVQRRHEANRRQLLLRHLLLLLLRGAAIVLLGLALARPSIQPSARLSGVLGSQEAPVAAGLVFDAAPRMEYRHKNQTRLEAAQQLGLWLLGQLPRESDLAVLDTRLGPTKFEVDRLAAEERIERLETVADSQPLSRVVEEALRQVGQSDLERKEVYVFTDLSRGAWPTDSSARLHRRMADAPGVRVYVIDVGIEDPANFGLSELRLSGQVLPNRSSLRIETKLSCEGTGGDRTVELRLLDNQGREQKRNEESYTLSSGQSQRVDFRIGGLGIGTHQGFVRIVGQDGLVWDDSRFFTLEVKPAWRILVAAPKPTERYTLFLTEALAPTMLRKRGEARFHCEIVDQEELARQSLYDYAAICLLDPTPPEPAVWKKLSDFAADGHGVAVFLGRNASPVDAFNTELAQELLPGKLLRQARAPEGDVYLAPRDLEHPILRAFRGSVGSIPWNFFPVFRYWELENPVGEILQLTDGRPALLERPLASGRVLTMTTPVSDDPNPNRNPWNLLPVGEAWPFLILVNGMMSYLVGTGDQRLNYSAGEVVELQLDTRRQHDIYQVFAPDDLTFRIPADLKRHVLVVSSTGRVGNYRVRAGGLLSGVDRGFSVNLTPRQTRLDRISEEELAEIFGPGDYRLARSQDEIERDVSIARVGRELFPALIVLVVVVLGLEHLVANRFYRE